MSIDSRVVRVAAPLRQQVADRMRDDILEGEFAPGQRLVEGPLCERYGVSRTVVREALRILEAEALIVVEPNRGPIVAILTEHDVRELYQVRRSLEGLAGELFAQSASADECQALVYQLNRLEQILPNAELREQVAAKDAYYEALLAGTHNGVLQRMVESIHGRTRLFRGFSLLSEGRTAESLGELRAITAAAAIHHDPLAARVACETHIERAGELALRELTRRAASASPPATLAQT